MVSVSVCIGRTDISMCPLVTDIVYVPPPLKRSLGCDKWLKYWCPAKRKAELDIRYVFDIPGGICMHSGIMIRIVSLESSVMMPWNSPIIRLS